jgi:AbrB family looped-hinge helix DNA binding protein
MNLATTKMSSRGQVVIPESIRKRLRLVSGSQFIVIAQDDMMMFKIINPPSPDEYNELKKRLREQARKTGLKQTDISKAISKARGHY